MSDRPSRSGCLPLIFSIVLVIGSVAAFFYAIATMLNHATEGGKNYTSMAAPGEQHIQIHDTTLICVWHDYQTNFNGRNIDTQPEIEGKFDFTLRRIDDLSYVEFMPLGGQVVQKNGVSRYSLGLFSVSEPGEYLFEADAMNREQRIISTSTIDLLQLLSSAAFGFTASIACFIFACISFLWGIFKLLTRPSPYQQNQSQHPS